MDSENRSLLPEVTSGFSCSFWQDFPQTLAVSLYCFLYPSCRSHTASRVSTFFLQAVFPSFATKWPPDQSFSELCLNRCNTKNWNQIPLIAHVKGRKTILASSLPALRRPASVWEDKKSFKLQQHFLSFCFLFILPLKKMIVRLCK